MSRNNPKLASEVRLPRGMVMLAGVSVDFKEFTVDTNAFSEADTASVSFAIRALPKGRLISDLLAMEKIELELRVGFPPDPQNPTLDANDTLFLGNVDSLSVDPVNGTASVQARDFTALLIDTKTTEQYRNKTASEVVETIAGLHGLTPVVTATTTKVGTYYQIDHVRQHKARTEWDLITWLAGELDYVAYVSGHELHFGPRPDPSQDPYVFELQPNPKGGPRAGNFVSISFDKDFTLAKGILVEVRSWNARRGAAIIKRAGAGGADAQRYHYSIPGLTPEQCQARADAIWSELSHHQVRANITGPADNILKISDVIAVRGTDFDQVFYPDSIQRKFGEGYSWTINAKNRSRDESGASQTFETPDTEAEPSGNLDGAGG